MTPTSHNLSSPSMAQMVHQNALFGPGVCFFFFDFLVHFHQIFMFFFYFLLVFFSCQFFLFIFMMPTWYNLPSPSMAQMVHLDALFGPMVCLYIYIYIFTVVSKNHTKTLTQLWFLCNMGFLESITILFYWSLLFQFQQCYLWDNNKLDFS